MPNNENGGRRQSPRLLNPVGNASYASVTNQQGNKKHRTNNNQGMGNENNQQLSQNNNATIITDIDMTADDDTTIARGSTTSDQQLYSIRCDMKLTFTPGNNPDHKCIMMLKEFLCKDGLLIIT